jgi:hypothetical protein
MQEKFVVQLSEDVDISHLRNQLYLLPQRWLPLTAIAHTTEEEAKKEIASHSEKHPMKTAIYKIERYFIDEREC